jgi:hypothetical protein
MMEETSAAVMCLCVVSAIFAKISVFFHSFLCSSQDGHTFLL